MTKKPVIHTTNDNNLPAVFDLECLARSIQTAHEELARQASKAVNVSLTVRNWLIGHYIAEFEMNGADRASYGDKLLDRLAERLTDLGVSTCDKRRLYQYLRFYNTYPEIVRTLTAQFQKGSRPGRVRSGRDGQCVVRLQVPATTASQRRFDTADRTRTPTTI